MLDLLLICFISLLLGSFIGFLGGMFGIGGGTIGVPAFLLLFTQFQEIVRIPESVMMLVVLATSLCFVLFASYSATKQHKKYGNYREDISSALRYGFFVGGFIGSYVANSLSNDILILLVALLLYTNAMRLFLQKNQNNQKNQDNKTCEIVKNNPAERLLPKKVLIIFGCCAGIFSAVVGVGGAIFTIPLLLYCKVHMRQIIATTSSIAVYLAVGGILGYLLISLSLPADIVIPYSIGFIYIPAFLGSVIGSSIFAKVGVNVAQKMNVNVLTKLLASLFVIFGTMMLSKTSFFNF